MKKISVGYLSVAVVFGCIPLLSAGEAMAFPAAGTICRAAANYKGCYSDISRARLLPYVLSSGNLFFQNGTPISVSPSTCLAAAAAAGFKYAGMQAGNICSAGQGCADGTFNCHTPLSDSSCNSACTSGSAGWYCGQNGIESVYQTGGCDYSEAYDGSSNTCASDSVLPAGSISFSPNVGAPPTYGTYAGCFAYNPGDWTGQLTDRPTYNIAQCLADANAKGYPNAGLLNGSECFYTTVRPTTKVPESDCNSVCPREPKFGGQYCGGGTRWVSVYGTATCSTALACKGTSNTPPPTGDANIAFPAVPSISVSSPSSGTDVVTITGSGDVNYTVKYGPDNGNYTNSQGPIIGTSATVSSLDPTIFYHFTAYAYNSCGTSGNADDVAAPIWSCGDITSAGTYNLQQNINCPTPNSATCTPRSTTTNCLNARNVSDVTINCNGHSVVGGTGNVNNGEYRAALMVQNTLGGSNSNINVTSCSLDSVSEDTAAALFDCSNCSVTNSTIGANALNNLSSYGSNVANFQVKNSSNVNISSNHATSITLSTVSYAQLNNDTVTCIPKYSGQGAGIGFWNGTNNTVTGTTINGSWAGGGEIGCDDGITMAQQSYATIGTQAAPNTISNVWDFGVEFGVTAPGDYLHYSTFAYNTITNALNGGFGYFYYLPTDIVGNVFQNNTISQTSQGFRFEVPDPAASAYNFHDNSFINNVFLSPTTASGTPGYVFYSIGVPASYFSNPSIPINQSNNSFTGNTFDVYDRSGLVDNYTQFYSNTGGGVVDGGGNHCIGQGASFPLACTTP